MPESRKTGIPASRTAEQPTMQIAALTPSPARAGSPRRVLPPALRATPLPEGGKRSPGAFR